MPTSVDAGLVQALVALTIFAFGMVVSWLVWLSLRHYNYAKPAYERIFGTDEDETADGHLADSEQRFDTIDEAVTELQRETDQVHDDVRKVERRQELVLSNQKTIANALDVDLETPRFYRGSRGDIDPGQSDD